ncbi:type III secretion system chaperone [Pseudoduganella sp. R-43]
MNEDFHVRQCVRALGAKNGITGWDLDGDGSSGLRLRDGSEIYLRYAPAAHRLYVYAVLAPLSSNRRPEIALSLLQNNCLEEGSEGGVLSVSDRLAAFVYHVALPSDHITVGKLEHEINAFLVKRRRMAQLVATR